MSDDLLGFLIEKSGAPTLVLISLAVLWDRLKKLEERVDDHATKLWDMHEDERR